VDRTGLTELGDRPEPGFDGATGSRQHTRGIAPPAVGRGRPELSGSPLVGAAEPPDAHSRPVAEPETG
jgi:hypothetical protein